MAIPAFRSEPSHEAATAARSARVVRVKGPAFSNAIFSADELAIFEAKLCGFYPVGTFPQFMSRRRELG
jgi:hypothetical protein